MKLLWMILGIGSMLLGYLLSRGALTFLWVVFNEGRGRDQEVIPFLVPVALLPSAIGYGLPYLVLTWVAWTAIQDGKPRFNPPLATLLLLVPCLNVVWPFFAYWGWTQDFNAYARQKNLNVKRAPEGLALAVCIVDVLSFVPCLGFTTLILRVIYYVMAINSIESLYVAKAAAGGTFPPVGSMPMPAKDQF